MKVFRVVTERLPGGLSSFLKDGATDIQTNRRFAATTIYDVISNLHKFIDDGEDLVAVIEEHPEIIILDS